MAIQALTHHTVISSALDLITREMANLGLDPGFSTPQQQPPPPMPQPMPDVQMPTDIPITETVYPASFEIPAQQSPYEPEQLFQTPWADNMNPNAMAVDRGVFEALSSFEPLSVRVGVEYTKTDLINVNDSRIYQDQETDADSKPGNSNGLKNINFSARYRCIGRTQ